MLSTVLFKHHTIPFLEFVVSEPNPYQTFQYNAGQSMKTAYKMLVRKLEVGRPFERPKHIWSDTIKKKILKNQKWKEGRNLLHLA
jgi:hypothetical protein